MWPRAFLCQIRDFAYRDFTNAALTGALLQSSTLPKGGRHGRRICIGCHCALRRDARTGLGDRSPQESAMTTIYLIGGLLCVALGAYLLYALIKPEKF
jgi:K+-transporting ATPase KdpF subunit